MIYYYELNNASTYTHTLSLLLSAEYIAFLQSVKCCSLRLACVRNHGEAKSRLDLKIKTPIVYLQVYRDVAAPSRNE